MFRIYKPRTAPLRWKRLPEIFFFKHKNCKLGIGIQKRHPVSLLGHRLIAGWKQLKNKIKLHNYMQCPTYSPVVIEHMQQLLYPYRELMLGRDFFGRYSTYTNSSVAYPGFILWPLKSLKKVCNQFFYLKNVPINLLVSFVFNNVNTKTTFARSSGSRAYKRRLEKKTKLLCVDLPSKAQILLPFNTLCVTGPSYNFFVNSAIEGKWGSTLHAHKSLHVRGVAKNPVDHPNGGRTKAKQPELSPWGWIAKHSKYVPFVL